MEWFTACPYPTAERRGHVGISLGKIQNRGVGSANVARQSANARPNLFNKMTKKTGNIFPAIVNDESADAGLHNAANGKHWQHCVQKVKADWPNIRRNIENSLWEHTFTTSPYKIKTIFEPKQRDIYILPFNPDRIIQNMLMRATIPIWTPLLIPETYACIENRGQHKASTRLMEMVRLNKFCLQCDVRKFYPSLWHDSLYELVCWKIKCKDTRWLFRDIIYSVPGGQMAPIGNYTSQWLGTIAMNVIDQQVKHKYRVKDYIRYCDDFLFFSNDKGMLRELQTSMPEILWSALKLKLSKNNLFRTSQGVDFLGYVHFPEGYILLRKRTAKRVKQRVAQLEYDLRHGKITREHVQGSLASTMGWLKWANCHNLTMSLDIKKAHGGYT